ncbi:MAG TPA: hypothetical protein VJO34_14395 [Methylomirabilota bacterium]|nr:hypothetical protein [Methylomirabilota bacterium]
MRRAKKKGTGRKGRAKPSKPVATPIDPRFSVLFRRMVQLVKEVGRENFEQLVQRINFEDLDEESGGVFMAMNARVYHEILEQRKREKEFRYPTAGNHGK